MKSLKRQEQMAHYALQAKIEYLRQLKCEDQIERNDRRRIVVR
jgi:hypothetical protein